MDGDGFDDLNVWATQLSASGPATAPSAGAGFDLNSQAPAAEGFPGLGMYGAFLQGDNDELLTSRTGHGGGNGGAFPGGLSSGRGGRVRQRSCSVAAAPGRQSQRSNTAVRAGGSGQRLPRPRAPRAARSAVRGQASGSGAPFNNEDEELEDDVEEFASFGGPPVSQASRAQWNEVNNACLLDLCIERRRVGTYNGAQMSGEGYQAIVDGLLDRRGLVYTHCQVKNQILVLKTTHSFWRYLQAHIGLGRLPDGTIDVESSFWKIHTEKKPYLKRLQWDPPENEELLDQLFRGYTVDGSTAFVPGDDYVKKSKSPMLKIVKDIASTFKEAVIVNTKQMQKRASDKAAFSVKRCQELAFECGVEQTIESVSAMSKMFETEYQREFFCGQLTPDLRLGYFKKWKKIMALWLRKQKMMEAAQSVRQADNCLRRSLDTVSRTFNRVLTCLLRLAHDIIVPKDPTFSEVHPNLENPAFWPHFNDCIGAIDGTHVNVVVPKSKRVPYLNRHNETSQNVLAVCDFDMRFTFVLSGWPGSAHDMRVFKNAVSTYHHKFPHPPPGKYYVVDAGYPNRPGYLSPYTRIRYHVAQWNDGPPPQDREFDACDEDENYNPMPSSVASEWPADEPLVEDAHMNAFRDELAQALFYGV
uniref:Transposon protein, putative, CACTA, En/Spm sub-class n=2 Tax=Oryza sativa subsp. japonica TaxID=39947 RepID=Q60DK1_ORYSJ|nr:transposon protein, putative, CACTA, En/Spm sub-class [Oryza sativa Japonica Group]ABF97886.1 transposon protein, putative, CACTA, En/Spm sub-class [Oryza sativa Japonica Group]